MDWRCHAGKCVEREQVVFTQDVPEVSPRPLIGEKRLAAWGRPPGEHARPVVEVHELLEGRVPTGPREHVRASDRAGHRSPRRRRRPACAATRTPRARRRRASPRPQAPRPSRAARSRRPTRTRPDRPDLRRARRRHTPDLRSRRGSSARPRPGRCPLDTRRSRRAVALGPQREHLLPLAGAAHAAVQEHHGCSGAALDDLDAAVKRRREDRGCRNHETIDASPTADLPCSREESQTR